MPPPNNMLTSEHRVSTRIAVRERRCAPNDDVRLCAVALDVHASSAARRSAAADRRGGVDRRAGRPPNRSAPASRAAVVVHVTRDRDDDVLGMVRALVQLAQIAHARARRHRLARAENRVAVGVLRPTAPRCAARRRDRPACRRPC